MTTRIDTVLLVLALFLGAGASLAARGVEDAESPLALAIDAGLGAEATVLPFPPGDEGRVLDPGPFDDPNP